MSDTLFLVVNIWCNAAEGGRKISFSNYFNDVPNVSLMCLLREISDERRVEACLSAHSVVDGAAKEAHTTSSTGIKITSVENF